MIKFFRNIRKNLLNEGLPAGQAGKTTRYFKYAIGDILLVVINKTIICPFRDKILVARINKKLNPRAVRYDI